MANSKKVRIFRLLFPIMAADSGIVALTYRSLSEAEGTDEKINEKQGKKTIFEPSSLSLQ
jgi:hypothetical protein